MEFDPDDRASDHGEASSDADRSMARLVALIDAFERGLSGIKLEMAVISGTQLSGADFTSAREASLRILAMRQALRSLDRQGLLQDVAFDVMLDLFASQSRDRRSSITDVCAGTGIPETTIRRGIQRLQKAGLLERYEDPRDHRRNWVALAPSVYLKLAQALHSLD